MEVDESRGPASPIGLINAALRHGRVLVAVPLVAMLVAGAVSLLLGSSYQAESTFKPETSRLAAGGLAGMAATMGLNLGSLNEGESVDYYARLVTSREILSDLVRSEFPVREGAGPRGVDLLTLYDIEGETPERRLWNGVERLRKDVTVSVDHSSSLVTVQTEAPSRELAEQLNARLLELLNRFNLEKRQSQARAERNFVEAQVEEAAGELAAAEDRLAAFLAQNRRYQNSPELANEADRLRRRVSFRQQVFTSLAESREKARLDEVRNTPVFTVLDRPEGSARELGGLLSALVMGLILGLVLAGFWVFVREYADIQRARHPDDFRELDQRLDGLRRRLLPWRRRTRHGRTEAADASLQGAHDAARSSSAQPGRRP